MAKDVISLEELKSKFGQKTSILDLQNIFNDFIQKEKIERITRIRDTELDRICRMLYFGIRHTSILNYLSIKKNKTPLNFQNITYEDLELSSILEYTLINLNLRLSLDSQSRTELKDIITSLVKTQLEKELNAEKEQENKI